MNYYGARQRINDKKWKYTCKNGKEVYSVGYCSSHEDGHDTPEEAQECYKKYLLDNQLRLHCTSSSAHRCLVCKEWTPQYAEVGFRILPLCDEHRTRAEVEKQFKAPKEVISSY